MIGTCPMGGETTWCESVDVGVGHYMHPDGFACWSCDWSESGPLQPELTMDERPSAPLEAYL